LQKNDGKGTGRKFFLALKREYLLMNTGLETWLKYQHLFPSKNFLFLVKRETNRDEHIAIYFLNKKAFINNLRCNLRDLNKKLGKSFTEEEFLNCFIHEDAVFSKLLKESHSAFGILLGYGKENADLFERFCEIKFQASNCHFTLRKTRLTPSLGFSSLDEELEYVENQLGSFVDDKEITNFPFAFLTPLSFRANLNSPETTKLKKRCLQEHRNIVRLYRKGDFLETTLTQLTKD